MSLTPWMPASRSAAAAPPHCRPTSTSMPVPNRTTRHRSPCAEMLHLLSSCLAMPFCSRPSNEPLIQQSTILIHINGGVEKAETRNCPDAQCARRTGLTPRAPWSHASVPASAGDAVMHRLGGKTIVKVLPEPYRLLMRSSAPWRMATCLVIASPRPVPPVARDRPRSAR